MVTGKAQDPVPLIPQALVLVVIPSTVRPLGLLHYHPGPTALLIIVRVRQHQSIQLIWQWAAQQDSQSHSTSLAAPQSGAEVGLQFRGGLLVYQVIDHQVLQPLRIGFGGNLPGKGTAQIITSQDVLSPTPVGLSRPSAWLQHLTTHAYFKICSMDLQELRSYLKREFHQFTYFMKRFETQEE